MSSRSRQRLISRFFDAPLTSRKEDGGEAPWIRRKGPICRNPSGNPRRPIGAKVEEGTSLTERKARFALSHINVPFLLTGRVSRAHGILVGLALPHTLAFKRHFMPRFTAFTPQYDPRERNIIMSKKLLIAMIALLLVVCGVSTYIHIKNKNDTLTIFQCL